LSSGSSRWREVRVNKMVSFAAFSFLLKILKYVLKKFLKISKSLGFCDKVYLEF
jgi:hypothetical protein